MARALQLAARGLTTTDPNPRVGCIIAHAEKTIGEGWHDRAGEPHAEILALRAAGSGARGATAYVTLEPCSHHGRTPPCVEPLIAAGIARVVCATIDPNPKVSGSGLASLRNAGITAESGLLEAQARELNCGFVKRMTLGLPWVRIKLGVSLDGRTALTNAASRWITSEESRRDVQRWRARSSAILTGSTTVLKDDPRLDVRAEAFDSPPRLPVRQPLRVIADSELQIPVTARVFSDPAQALVFTAAAVSPRQQEFEARGIRIQTIERGAYGLNLFALLRRLAQLEINEVWVESGSRLAGALLQERLADEVVVYMAPSVLGSGARGMFQLPELESLDERVTLKFEEIRNIGMDLRIIARPV